MSLTAEFHREMADSRAATAIEFVFGDTFVNARKYAESTVTVSRAPRRRREGTPSDTTEVQ